MSYMESAKLLLAASGGDTVKLFDVSVEPQNPCVLTYTPSPGFRVNSVKWNHNNLVLASAGEDGKISLWRKNGRSLWTVPAKNSSEFISTINFSNKGSRYLCSGGSGHVVRIWDLQNERCVKSLKGHTDTITGVMYNCKDEYIASVSRKGDLILHNLASGTKSAELSDPDGQVLGALDYSRISRHLLVTAGDDGSVHLWDATARSPKVSWAKQHSAPISSVSFSPCNDKIIASVGLDMKLYTFDSGSRKPSSCIAYEAPFSSLAITDDGLTLAAGTSTGQVAFYDIRGKPQPITVLRAYGNSEAVTNLCWQRSKPTTVNENNCTDEIVLLAGDVGDSIVMPDPLPSKASSILSMSSAVSGSRNPNGSEETPHKSSLLTGVTLKRLHPPRSYNFKDDMDVFSPLVEVQPITHNLDKMWDADADSDSKKNDDRKHSLQFPPRRFGFQEDGTNENHPIFDWKSKFSYKQDDIQTTFSQLTSTLSSTYSDDPSSITPPEAWGGEKLSDKCIHHRPTINKPSRFAALTTTSISLGSMLSGLQSSLPASQSTSSSTSVLTVANLHPYEIPCQETSLGLSENISSPLGTKKNTGQASFHTSGPALSLPRKFSSYEERISASSISDAPSFSTSSPKSKKSGSETRGEVLNSFLTRSEMIYGTGTAGHATTNGGGVELQRNSLESDTQQGTSFTLQLFQHTLEETLTSFQTSIHEDIRNLHIEILRQFHVHEMEMSSVMGLILENQAEIMKELKSLRKETQQRRQLL